MTDLAVLLDRIEKGLSEYANPQHWAIERDDLRHPRCVWIGPGALSRVPDGPGVARDALAACAELREALSGSVYGHEDDAALRALAERDAERARNFRLPPARTGETNNTKEE